MAHLHHQHCTALQYGTPAVIFEESYKSMIQMRRMHLSPCKALPRQSGVYVCATPKQYNTQGSMDALVYSTPDGSAARALRHVRHGQVASRQTGKQIHLLACCSCLLRVAVACCLVGAASPSFLLLAMWEMKAVHAICRRHSTSAAQAQVRALHMCAQSSR